MKHRGPGKPANALHLGKRFLGSLWPAGPSRGEEAWARAHLVSGEIAHWANMSGPDRRHAVGVARRVERALGDEATRPVLAAALLHDVGKVASGLGTFRRVAATLVGSRAGDEWADRGGIRRRFALYGTHDRLGADMLEVAGADALTVAWAREHHLPPSRWTVPLHLANALKAADDD